MYSTLKECPSCGKDQFENYIICKDHSVSQESFAIVICKACNLKFTNPRPTREELGKYYESENYISHSNKSNSLINFVYKIVRSFTLRGKVNILDKHKKSKKKNLLDIGCGTGEFLSVAQKKGWNITGIEPSPIARKQSEEIIDSTIYTDIKELKSTKKFTAITMWHVLEHVDDLAKTLSTLHALLSKNGTLIIAVPNPNSYDAQKYKEYWAAYDVPRHLYHFTPESLTTLLKKHGFKIANTLPMMWDAYYVSMLSEKYMSGHTNYFKSIISGYKSNSYAKYHKKNYSSIIYIVRK